MIHSYRQRVYHADTDAAGIVYHPNYLSFFSHARVEWARERGYDMGKMHREGYNLPIQSIQIEYLAPAYLDDELVVHTKLAESSRVRLVFSQTVSRYNEPDKILCKATVVVVCTDKDLKPRRLPESLKE